MSWIVYEVRNIRGEPAWEMAADEACDMYDESWDTLPVMPSHASPQSGRLARLATFDLRPWKQ